MTRVCLGRENICKNCIKEDVCKVAEDFYKNSVYGMYIESCDYYEDRNRFVELPCEFGSTVYEMVLNKDKSFSYFNTHKVVGVHLGDFPNLRGQKRQEYLVTHCESINYLSRIPLNKLGKTVFLTKSEAEQALKERENNG